MHLERELSIWPLVGMESISAALNRCLKCSLNEKWRRALYIRARQNFPQWLLKNGGQFCPLKMNEKYIKVWAEKVFHSCTSIRWKGEREKGKGRGEERGREGAKEEVSEWDELWGEGKSHNRTDSTYGLSLLATYRESEWNTGFILSPLNKPQ